MKYLGFIFCLALIGCNEPDPFRKEVQREVEHMRMMDVPKGQTICEKLAIPDESEVYMEFCKDAKP